MKQNTICLHTEVPPRDIISDGGAGNWVINVRNFKAIDYVVLTQLGGIKRNRAFIIAKVERLEESYEPGRRFIHFAEMAEVDIADVWNTKDQNCIRYTTMADLGIDVDDLKWQSVAEIQMKYGLTQTQNPASIQARPPVRPQKSVQRKSKSGPVTIIKPTQADQLSFQGAIDALKMAVASRYDVSALNIVVDITITA